jgi:hypothetical protein
MRQTVIPCVCPGYAVAVARQHDDGRWTATSHPIIAWTCRDDAPPEPVAIGLPADWATEQAVVCPNGQAHANGMVFDDVGRWLRWLGGAVVAP